MKNVTLVIALAISLLIQLPVANAYGRHGGYYRGDAVAAGLLGLGVGMAIAAPRVHYYNYRDDDYYRSYPHYRQYWRHHSPRHHHYDNDDRYDYRDHDWND